jgi:hypothetical protein
VPTEKQDVFFFSSPLCHHTKKLPIHLSMRNRNELPIRMQPKKYAIGSSIGNEFPSMIMLFPLSIPSN